MKDKAFLLIFTLFLGGCTHLKTEHPATPAEVEIKAKPLETTRAVFHVIEPAQVTFKVVNLTTKKEQTILLDKEVVDFVLEPGHWQISEFIMGDKHFKVMNTSKKFIFKLAKNRNTYVGSYLIQCPKVGNSHFKDMKKMSFFNRYPYSSTRGLCEMVVGSDFTHVKKIWSESSSNKHRTLSVGF